MHSQSTTISVGQLTEMLLCKKLLEESLNQLETLATQQQLSFQCIPDIRQLLNTANQLRLFGEFDNQVKASENDLYQFLNTFYQYNIYRILPTIMEKFYKRENEIRISAYDTTNLIINHFNQLKEYIARLIANIFIIREVNEFDFFQKMESSAIKTIKSKLEAGIDDFLLRDLLTNSNMLEEYGKKRFIMLCAALLKEGIDYANIFKFGLKKIPGPAYYASNKKLSDELVERQRQEVAHHSATIESVKFYLHYLSLIMHGMCSYEDVHKKIQSMKFNPQFNKISDRIKLHGILGDYVYYYDSYFILRNKHAKIKHLNINKEDEVKWLTTWRDQELNNLVQQARPYPELFEKFNSLRHNKIDIKVLGTAIAVIGIGNIGDLILTLNAYEMKSINQTKLMIGDFNFLKPTDKESDIPNKENITPSCCTLQ